MGCYHLGSYLAVPAPASSGVLDVCWGLLPLTHIEKFGAQPRFVPAQDLCCKLPTFKPCFLSMATLHPNSSRRGLGEGLGTWVELDSPWTLRVLADLV